MEKAVKQDSERKVPLIGPIFPTASKTNVLLAIFHTLVCFMPQEKITASCSSSSSCTGERPLASLTALLARPAVFAFF